MRIRLEHERDAGRRDEEPAARRSCHLADDVQTQARILEASGEASSKVPEMCGSSARSSACR